MSSIGRRLAQQYPEQQAGRDIGLIRLHEEMVRNARPALLALMAAVGLVLLIACTNVANLLLARATSRRREMALRSALGAGLSAFHRRLLDRVSALPGVQAAGIINMLPLQSWGTNGGVEVEGQSPSPPGQEIYVELRAVSPNYFRALGVPLIAGRFVDDRDQENSAKVILVNRTFVATLMPNQNPLGKILKREGERYEIVGVVGDVKQSGLTQPARPEMYWHYSQVPIDGLRNEVSLATRAAGDPNSLTSSIRSAVLAIDPSQPIHNVKTMEEVIAESISDQRLNMLLLGIFAALAVSLASIGVYSVMSYLVAQHTRELGIRIALGAQARDILKLILAQRLSLAAVGVIVGLAGAFALTRLMENLLFGVKAVDPVIYIVAPLALILIALLACFLPAQRAMKVDPITALRSE